MITQGPYDLTLNTTLPLNDPGANSNNAATAVQIQNASPFIIDVNAGGTVLTIQSFTAQTVPTSGGGQQMSVTPIATNIASVTTAPKVLTVVWLLAGESSPMVDGPLTAAAILAVLGSLTNYNVGGGSMATAAVINAGATATLAAAPPPGKCYRVQLYWQNQSPNSGPVYLQDSTGPHLLAVLTTSDTRYLGGQLCFGAIQVNNQSSAATGAGITYDEITIPVAP